MAHSAWPMARASLEAASRISTSPRRSATGCIEQECDMRIWLDRGRLQTVAVNASAASSAAPTSRARVEQLTATTSSVLQVEITETGSSAAVRICP